MAHFVLVIASARTSVAPICPSTSATRLSVLPVSHRSSTSRTRRPWTAVGARLDGRREQRGTLVHRDVLHLLRRRCLDCRGGKGRHPETPCYARSDQHRRLLCPVQRWRRRNNAVDDAAPSLGDEGHRCFHDVVQSVRFGTSADTPVRPAPSGLSRTACARRHSQSDGLRSRVDRGRIPRSTARRWVPDGPPLQPCSSTGPVRSPGPPRPP